MSKFDLPHWLAADFFQTYWRKQALFSPAALTGHLPQIPSTQELLAMAVNLDIESRLVISSEDYVLREGPISSADWEMYTEPRSLLLQAMDFHLPELASLWRQFAFLPRWLRDDIMLSHSSQGGGVGPHFDQYDVFLIQARGSREWRLGQQCGPNEALRDDSELLLLSEFRESVRFQCQPGDVLYVPPGLAHWGIASSDDCVTLSVGLRGPSSASFVQVWSDDQQTAAAEFRRLPVPGSRSDCAGEISEVQIDVIQAALREVVEDREALAKVLGQTMTEAKYPEDFDARFETPPSEQPAHFALRPETRLCSYAGQDAGYLSFFINGEFERLPIANGNQVAALCRLEQGERLPADLAPQLLELLWQHDAIREV